MHTHTRTHGHMHSHTHPLLLTHTHTHTQIHARMHECTHMHMHAGGQASNASDHSSLHLDCNSLCHGGGRCVHGPEHLRDAAGLQTRDGQRNEKRTI